MSERWNDLRDRARSAQQEAANAILENVVAHRINVAGGTLWETRSQLV